MPPLAVRACCRLRTSRSSGADLPPISSKHTEPWVPGLLRTVGAAWIVVDLADPACAKRSLVIGTELAQRKIKLRNRWSGVGAGHRVQPASHSPATDAPAPEEVLDPVRVQLPILLAANSSDLKCRYSRDWRACAPSRSPGSARTGHGLKQLPPFVSPMAALELHARSCSTIQSPGQHRLPRAFGFQPLRRFPAQAPLLSASSSRASGDRVAGSAAGARSQTLVLRAYALFSLPTAKRIVPRST